MTVPAGWVKEIVAVRHAVAPGPLLALGAGRVIDTAKAVAAGERLRGLIASPTSFSGAEMTGVHRHANGVPDDTPRSRASVIVKDPP